MHSTAPPEIPSAPTVLQLSSFHRLSKVEPWDSSCWHRVSRWLLPGYRHCFFSGKRTLPEKEVIQPHLPVRLPCYDFTPVTSPAFGIPLLAVKVTTSGMARSHSVTGGVYKARE
ncbi:hypothetical protein Fmac_018202 [Flemingia macrophylla]|uniref:Uncharacterized protein n=1 Tax=Flemingia macrophylla TaxID=520843 RepID=A0ABD1M4D7_9FABA